MKTKQCLAVLILVAFATPADARDLIPLRAGPLSMMLDADKAMLRFIRVGKHEVLRGLNAPVRNQFWGTLATKVTNLVVRTGRVSFVVSFDVSCKERDIDFAWKGKIVGTSKGELSFTFDGVAHTTFKKNRIGFCVLHGPSAAGQKWRIEHTDGSKKPGQFPRYISPNQPAKDIRAISHEVAPGMWATVRCEGDTFEMEDQRNWTDGSFKTYCTPLAIPYPVQIAKGTKISHKVRLSLSGDVGKYRRRRRSSGVVLTIDNNPKSARPMPKIGLQASSQVEYLSGNAILRLHHLRLDHLRVRIGAKSDPRDVISRSQKKSHALGTPLQLVVELDEKKPADQLKKIIAAIKEEKSEVATIQILAVDSDKFRSAHGILAKAKLGAAIGVAEDTNFTELNRNRPKHADIKVVSFGLNPQCHASDILTMVETLEIQGTAVQSAKQFVGKRRLMVGPVTLKVQKVNQAPLPGQLPSNEDARQASVFTASWTIGSFKYLAEAGVESVSYFETVGRKGVMAARNQVPTKVFPAKPLAVYPVYHVLRAIGDFKGGSIQPVKSSSAMSAVGLVMKKGGRLRMLIANFNSGSTTIRIRGLQDKPTHILKLDRGRSHHATRRPDEYFATKGKAHTPKKGMLNIRLESYGLARIDQ